MNRKRWISILIAGVLLLGFGIGLFLWIKPKLQTGVEIVAILKEFIDEKNQSIELELDVEVGDTRIETNLDVYRVQDGERAFLCFGKNDYFIYYCDHVLYLENGKAYGIGEAWKNDSPILMQIMGIYEVVDITREEEGEQVVYTAVAKEDKAKELIATLVPSLQKEVPEDVALEIKLTTVDGELEQAEIIGNISLNDSADTQLKMDVVLSDFNHIEDAESVVPKTVLEEAEVTDSSSVENIGEDMYRLILAWIEFSGRNSLSGSVTLDVECGVIDFEKEIPWEDLNSDKGISEDSKVMKNIPALLYLLCLNGEFSCEQDENVYVYELTLDEEGMQNLSETLVPEIKTQAVNLENGTVYLTIEDRTIISMEIVIAGDVDLLLTEVDASISALFEFEK